MINLHERMLPTLARVEPRDLLGRRIQLSHRSRQLASEEANLSGSALFVIQYVNLLSATWLSNLTGCNLEKGMAT